MSLKEIQKRINRIWANQEKEIGVSIPDILRSLIENDMLAGINDKEALEDFESALPDYLRIYLIGLKARSLLEHQKEVPVISVKKRMYQKCFERRLRIVGFIIDRKLNLNNMIQRNLKIRGHIDWKQITNAWNKAYPYDRIQPEVLKVEFYRAKSEEYLRQVYLNKKDEEWNEVFASELKAWEPAIKELSEITLKIPSLSSDLELLQQGMAKLTEMAPALDDISKEIKGIALLPSAITSLSSALALYRENAVETIARFISVIEAVKKKKEKDEVPK
jgi:hypothetical protein